MDVLGGGGCPGEIGQCVVELVHGLLEELQAVVERPPVKGSEPLDPAMLDAGAVGVSRLDLPHGEVYGGGDDLPQGLGGQARE